MKITDIVVLGGVAVAGYFILKGGGGADGRPEPIQYISKVPLGLSPAEKPVTREPQSVPMIINLPSESVTFPAPKLPSVTSLLPPIPSEELKTPTVSAVTKTPMVSAVTKTPAATKKEIINYGYSEPSSESWRQFTKEVWGAEPGEFSKSQGGIVASFSEIKRFGMPKDYLRWLKNRIPTKKEISKQKTKLEEAGAGHMVEYFERMGHGGQVTLPSKKEQKVIPEKETETKAKPLFYQSMWSDKTKTTKPAKSTTKKETKEKKPPALPGITWQRSGSGWIPVRS